MLGFCFAPAIGDIKHGLYFEESGKGGLDWESVLYHCMDSLFPFEGFADAAL